MCANLTFFDCRDFTRLNITCWVVEDSREELQVDFKLFFSSESCTGCSTLNIALFATNGDGRNIQKIYNISGIAQRKKKIDGAMKYSWTSSFSSISFLSCFSITTQSSGSRISYACMIENIFAKILEERSAWLWTADDGFFLTFQIAQSDIGWGNLCFLIKAQDYVEFK